MISSLASGGRLHGGSSPGVPMSLRSRERVGKRTSDESRI